jgi:NAD(P)-dependent dehydrogenase (short-subunit alcohol dehydrogenase family)
MMGRLNHRWFEGRRCGIARKLATEGADVVITYTGNHAAAGKTVAAIAAEGVRGEAIFANASDRDAVDAAINKAAASLGGIDILVHNAGIAEIPSVVQRYAAWQHDLNHTGPVVAASPGSRRLCRRSEQNWTLVTRLPNHADRDEFHWLRRTHGNRCLPG